MKCVQRPFSRHELPKPTVWKALLMKHVCPPCFTTWLNQVSCEQTWEAFRRIERLVLPEIVFNFWQMFVIAMSPWNVLNMHWMLFVSNIILYTLENMSANGLIAVRSCSKIGEFLHFYDASSNEFVLIKIVQLLFLSRMLFTLELCGWADSVRWVQYCHSAAMTCSEDTRSCLHSSSVANWSLLIGSRQWAGDLADCQRENRNCAGLENLER